MTVCTLAAQAQLPAIPDPVPLTVLPGTPAKLTLPAPPDAVLWSIAIAAAPTSSPLIAGEYVFLSTLPGLVTAYDLKDGREAWRETISAEQPLAADGTLVFVAAGEAVHALRQADGAVAWRRPTGAITAPPLVKDGWVIVPGGGKLFALRAADGSIVWSIDSGPQRERATIDGDTLFVPLASGRVRALELTTGTVKWEQRVAGAPAEPLVVGDRLYFGATDKYFYCLKTANGEQDWRVRVGAEIRGRAATDGNRVFFVGLDNLVRALGRESGAQRWQAGVPFRPFAGPVVAASSVFVAGPSTDVRQLHLITGRDDGKVTFPERLAIAPAVASLPKALFIAGVSGGLTETWRLWLASPLPSPAPAK